ncbi:MAG: PDZ domain-containing protein [Pyrinomonadaceae bacterium MAG19_C2-C3]|nr:PDZ domain-containing protein [Pyrinomonadaceae bacterium MAG19_C2-C3]
MIFRFLFASIIASFAFVGGTLTLTAQPRRPAAMPVNQSPTNQPSPDISYTVSMPRPYTHLLEVEMRVRAAAQSQMPASLDVRMPVWTPGSYLIREYARHVQDFTAQRGGNQNETTPLAWTKTNKNTWRITTGGAPEIIVRYNVYANELTVRTNELNDRHAFWNNAATLMYVEGFLNAPSTVTVKPFGNWKIATGLPQATGGTTEAGSQTFAAPNYDILYDSPFLVSDFKAIDFEVRGKPHRFVVDGEGNYDLERLRRDVPKIVEESAKMMNGLPYDNYTFLLMTHPTAGGGLEHLNSTALIARRFSFAQEESYRGFLSLVAHEFFHLWNVKRIRPDALGTFDYNNENYTRLLWVAEGVTSYYENVLLRRAGLMTVDDYLKLIGNEIRALQSTPGRLAMSVEEASFDAWIEYYRPDENTINSAISYYDKGALVGLLLDLEILRRTDGARSLDDVMRALYTDFALKNRNYTPADFQATAERITGSSLNEFFNQYVRGRAELPFAETLQAFGLTLNTMIDPKAAPKAFFGATLAQDGERLTVRNVPVGTPAYEQGITAGDQIIALNGTRVTLATLNERLGERRPGDEVTLTIFRLDELRTFPVKLGQNTLGDFRITPVNNPSPAQRRLYESWLGTPMKTAMSDE